MSSTAHDAHRGGDQGARGVAAIVGGSPAMVRLREVTRRVGRSRAKSIAVFGESGTGKGLVARALHEESDRRRAPFVSLTCSAIPEQLLESELFGHEPGAFTDGRERRIGLCEAANGGTLFLDEIGDMPPALQAKLLGVLEERVVRRVGGVREVPVDLRVISATHRNLEEMVRAGAFREDLLYRLCVVPVELPPLRAHPEDIPELAEHFAAALQEHGAAKAQITSEAALFLQGLTWRGNVRELRNAVERAMTLSPGPRLDVSAFEWQRKRHEDHQPLPREGLDVEHLVDGLVRQALRQTAGNQTAAAKLLSMTRNQLRYRMSKMGLLPPPAGVEVCTGHEAAQRRPEPTAGPWRLGLVR